MKKQTTSDRLKQIMSERNLRQVDILEMCKPYCQKYNIKLGRNDLSQYVTGKVEPGQKKLTILGKALNVSEAWLMGFDVPMERENKWADIKKSIDKIDAFEAQLKAIGWNCEYFNCNDWDLIENGGMGLNDDGEMVEDGTGYPVGCSLPDKGYTKCQNCAYRHPHYRFSNGTLSFDVSPKEYHSFRNDVELFYKKRLQKLLLKSSEQIFNNENELHAAHERTDIEVTEEMRKHDDDIMTDDSEWE